MLTTELLVRILTCRFPTGLLVFPAHTQHWINGRIRKKERFWLAVFQRSIRTGFIYCAMPEYQCTTMSCIIRIHP